MQPGSYPSSSFIPCDGNLTCVTIQRNSTYFSVYCFSMDSMQSGTTVFNPISLREKEADSITFVFLA